MTIMSSTFNFVSN